MKGMTKGEQISLEEQEWIFQQLNQTDAPYAKTKTIHQLFEEQVERTPSAIAAQFASETITYEQLNAKANQLARHLRSQGVTCNTVVGIMIDRSLEMIIGIMAILKAGGAYLPISPDHPDQRINYLLLDSGAQILLTSAKYLAKPVQAVPFINIEDTNLYQGEATNLVPISKATDLIYIIYTSGSTGKPKGVMIEHHSVVNRINWMQKRYPIGPQDTILQKTPFVFDVSVWELFWWGITGAKVCFLLPGFEKFPQAIVETVEKQSVTIMHFVPSMLNSFLNYVEVAEAGMRLASLKRVFASGEELTKTHVKKFNQILYQNNGTRLTNLYGPTEATVDVTYFDCPVDEQVEQIPIGKPIDNIQLFIFHEGELQPVGGEGELCISGVGLARGYLNRPELNAEKFILNPLLQGERMYRTGDLARLLPDGNIEFIGRMDHQVKIRGLRIELGEIESLIREHPSVDQCIVVARGLSTLMPRIVAYLVPTEEISLDELKKHLKDQLPEYMIPNDFVILDQFPLTANGKIDRKALPEA